MMVLMALLTTVMTTPLLQLVGPRALLRRAGDRELSSDRAARLLLCIGDASIGPAMARLAASSAAASGLVECVALHLERPRDRTSSYLGGALLGAEAARRAGLAPFIEAGLALGVKAEVQSFDSSDPAGDICEVARSRGSDYVVLGLHRPMLGQNVFGGIVGAVLAQSPAPVALLIDHGLARAFAPEAGARRVLVALSGGMQDACVLDFAQQLLKDELISLSVLWVGSGSAVAGGPLPRAEALAAQQPERVRLSSEPFPARQRALLAAAKQADLLVIGLDPRWGLSADGLDSEAARLLLACPASLLVLHERGLPG
jgi:nucleotide-binding universal stress UspA family protein